MWLMTKHGFYSIVEKEQGVFHVRSRETRDLQNLADGIPALASHEILTSDETDYRARIIVGSEELGAIMQYLAATLDYSNFKGRIDSLPGQRHKPYHEVWRILAGALGAYGRKGTARP